MTSELSLTKRLLRRVRYELISKRQGLGTPILARAWNREYHAGRWKYLENLDEHARYAIIASYVTAFGHNGRLLEMGCGNGVLTRYLHPQSYSNYIGIDLSTEAIEQAKHSTLEGRIEFCEGDFDTWNSTDTFDVIVFNECIYYARDPRATLERVKQFLSPRGSLIVSMFVHGNHKEMWQRIETRFPALDTTRVENGNGHQWTIKTLQAVPS